jgi:hypothetical protein
VLDKAQLAQGKRHQIEEPIISNFRNRLWGGVTQRIRTAFLRRTEKPSFGD